MIKTMFAEGIGAAVLILSFAPMSAYAAPSENAFLGGGNALARALSGQSQGYAHANTTSDLLAHLTFASTRGGRPDVVPPEENNENNAEGNGGNEEVSTVENEAGTSSGNGGNGGDAALGGLVRAGSVVSNTTAINVMNVNIVRIRIGN